jgi:hypothetical protein
MSEIKQEGEFKIKTPRKLGKTNDVTKVNLKAKKEQDAIQEQGTIESVLGNQQPEVGLQEVVQGNEIVEVVTENKEKEIIEMIAAPQPEIETVAELNEIVAEAKTSGEPLPENIEKLIAFMKETGGTIDDYSRLNVDYSNIKSETLIKEYYRKSRPHLDDDEIQFLMEEKFSYDEEIDDDRDIKKKRLEFKEEAEKAKRFLEDVKTKYYDEIKLRPSVSREQQEANEFFNRYKQDEKRSEQLHGKFKEDTKKLFTNDFKGFDFNLGEKTLRYNIPNTNAVIDKQSDISNLVKKFLNDKGEVVDVQGYHKAMYVADNSETIMKQIYEQGKADAVKEIMAKSNNVGTTPRTSAPESLFVNGIKIKAINGMDSNKLRIKKIT